MPPTTPPDKPRPGRKSHPLDTRIAETLKQHPNAWIIYPITIRWPDETIKTPADLRKIANRLTARIHHKWGALAPDDHGRFRIKSHPKELRIEIQYLPHKDTPHD